MANTIYSVAVSAKATIDMHSLNNEGGEGNQIQTRMVDVMDSSGRLHQVNAISGDMLKHMQAEHLFRLAQQGKHALCAACARFDANRISGDEAFIKRITTGNFTNIQTVDDMLRACLLDDMEGILITSGKRSVPRKSVAEFGWVVGVPNEVRTEQYFHVKYNSRARTQREATADADSSPETGDGGATSVADSGAGEKEADRSSNQGQAIFHRPASSGHYAIVTHLEVARIGYNDISQQYAIDETERTTRLNLLLRSLLHTFVQPNGAMRNTQLPHLVALEGVVSVSRAVLPAPTVSPLNPDYAEQIKGVAGALNRLSPDSLPGGSREGGEEAVTLYEFGSLAEFADKMADIATNAVPFRLVTH